MSPCFRKLKRVRDSESADNACNGALTLTPQPSSARLARRSVPASALLTEPLNPSYEVVLSILKSCVMKALLTFFAASCAIHYRLFSLEVSPQMLLLLNKSHSALLLAIQAPAIRFLHLKLASNQASRSPP